MTPACLSLLSHGAGLERGELAAWQVAHEYALQAGHHNLAEIAYGLELVRAGKRVPKAVLRIAERLYYGLSAIAY